MKSEKIEELLEYLWVLSEELSRKRSKDKIAPLKAGQDFLTAADWIAGNFKLLYNKKQFEKDLKYLADEDYIIYKNGMVQFTEKGTREAEKVVRRHRLAERLLNDLFKIKEDEMESSACKFEHILSPEVTDSVCSFLGHPPFCPHGKRIPRSKCCRKFKKEVKSVVVKLSDLEIGKRARIVFITPTYHTRFDRLTALGITPGSVLHLHQKSPSYVVKISETELALDKEICDEIYVKCIDM
ncbi:MAG: metal-dependent transcriptional regulator [Fidelibacterota bacterium]